MFELFSNNFPPDGNSAFDQQVAEDASDLPELNELIRRFGGRSFGGGLYRIISAHDLAEWKRRVSLAFPQFEANIECFGYDWLGTVFATNSGRLIDGSPCVVMFEPGTGKALNVPSNIHSFHETGLREFGEAALAIDFHKKWLASGGKAPAYAECVGYIKPLFLGGSDTVSNLEICDIDVYWHITGQLISQTRGLPEGTRINSSAK